MPTEAEKAAKLHFKKQLTRVRNRNSKKTSFSSTQYFYYISYSPIVSDLASDHHHLPIEDGY